MTQGRHKLSVAEPPQPGRHDEIATVDDVFPDLLAAEVRRSAEHEQVATAVVAAISSDGIATVIVRGETQSREASSLVQFPSPAAASEALLGRTVLVLLNQQTAPVILGVVAQRLWDEKADDRPAEAQVTLPTAGPVAVQLDKRQIDLEASDEIRLTCGKSSLVLRKDGTVIVRGVTIVSRASQANKIRGGTVAIN